MAEHGAALAIDAVNRIGVQVDNIDKQVDRELSAEGLGRMIISSHNGVVRGVFLPFRDGQKTANRSQSQVSRLCTKRDVPQTAHGTSY